MIRSMFIAGFAALGIIVPLSANATTATATFQVTATVNNACSLTTNPISFGAYNALLGSAVGVVGGVSVNCTLGSSFQIGMNAGTATSATVTTRKMTSGANTLNYGLYRDLANTQNWGNTPGTDTLGSTGTGIAVNYPIYATLPASQSVPSGSYADTITVTITY